MRLNTVRMDDYFCAWGELFNDEELSEIIKYCETIPKDEGLVGPSGNEISSSEIRKSKIAWIYRNQENDWFFSRIQSASNKLNSRFFGFDIDMLTMLQYTIYDEEDSHYDWHWDCYIGNSLNNFEDKAQRKLTSVIQLDSPDDYEEGFLQLNTCGDITEVERKKGFMVSFPSFILHRVTPVKSGLRRTLVAWFTGPDWR